MGWLHELSLLLGYGVLAALPVALVARARPLRRMFVWLLRRLDRGLRVFFELFFGPLETWRLYHYLERRHERRYGPEPSAGRGSLGNR
jgi:hypothetical protein